MRTLLIDNYDSFTYNLFQLLWEVNGSEPVVVRNDEASWEELARRGFDAVVVSPGPGRPERARDFGVCAEAILRCELPLLGVCLGHQGLGWVHGGAVVHAPEALHGRVRAVEHSGSPLFAGIPRRFDAVRYHSLCLARPLPDCLEEIAWSDDGVPMAIAHRSRPQWGVQFHPESVAAQHGRRLLANFRDLALGDRGALERAPTAGRRGGFLNHGLRKPPQRDPDGRCELRWRRLAGATDAEAAFVALYGESEGAFWLDGAAAGEDGRFSFMGDASGPLASTIAYDVATTTLTVERGGRTEVVREPILDYLDRELRRLRPARLPELPFAFDCGFVGYLGYELKADCGGRLAHRSPHPDATLVFADRLLAFDHELGHTYLLALAEAGEDGRAEAWIEETAAALGAAAPPAAPGTAAAAGAVGATAAPRRDPAPAGLDRASADLGLGFARSRRRYLDDIAACETHLLAGESYELCLTNAISADVDAEPFDLYRRLRRVNPAPFAAYLRCGDLAVLSSSPERFLAVGREGGVEARPIKGTCRRGEDAAEDARLAAALAADEKNRAENLMIVDLLRNDLGAVCEAGSVEAPSLMEVETYETVHQLVSTVRGRLREGLAAADCVRACFPPGSMTGAPKLRTVEILDRLEGAARGVYSGAIGYFGLGGGCDLSVAIRTIVLAGGRASVGAGGAIVLGSEAEDEYEEMLLKAAAPLRAIDPGLDPASISLADRLRGTDSTPQASVPDFTS